MGDLSNQPATKDPPRGMFPGKLDEKGRLKVPTAFQQYLDSLRENSLFVTSLDRRIAQIYPIAIWRANEEFFAGHKELAALARKVSFNANDLGAECQMDNQGRILFSPELRRELKMEGTSLHLQFYKGRIEVLTEEIYLQRRDEAAKLTEEDLINLEAAGLN